MFRNKAAGESEIAFRLRAILLEYAQMLRTSGSVKRTLFKLEEEMEAFGGQGRIEQGGEGAAN